MNTESGYSSVLALYNTESFAPHVAIRIGIQTWKMSLKFRAKKSLGNHTSVNLHDSIDYFFI